MVKFFREWQRKMILWGGQDVLKHNINWMTRLKKGEPDVKSMWMTEDFFRAVRKDLGHSSNRLEKGSFIRLLLKNTDSFILLSQKNPDIKLSEISEIEKSME